MNNLISKIVGVCLGLSLATGVGVGVAAGNQEAKEAKADTGSITRAGTSALSDTAESLNSYITIKTSSTNSYTSPARAYANVTITINAIGGSSLNSVTYEASSTGTYVTAAQNATVSPSVTPTVSGKNVTWSFSTNPTEFTFTPTAQTRWNNIIITYTYGASDPADAKLDSLIADSNPTNLSYYNDATNSDIDYTGASLKAHYTSASNSSWSKDVALSNSALTWAIDMDELELTASYTDTSTTPNVTKSYTWTVIDLGDRPLSGEITSFSAVSGFVPNTNEKVSYLAEKGDGTTAPFISSGSLRLYKPDSGKTTGGELTVSAATGYIIKAIILKTNRADSFQCSIDNGSQSALTSEVSGNFNVYSLSNLSASSVLFLNTYGDKHDISYLYVEYAASGTPVTTYSVTYDSNGGSGTMTDIHSPYASGATVTVLANSFTKSGYDFDHWNTASNDSGTSYNPNATFTISSNVTLYAQWVQAAQKYVDDTNAKTITWDLTKVSYDEATASKMEWNSPKASVLAEKGGAGTATNNYCPPDRTSTRFYKYGTLEFATPTNYEIVKVVATATSAGYATTLSGSTYSNGSAAADGTDVTITPTDGGFPVKVTSLSDTVGLSSIVVHYKEFEGGTRYVLKSNTTTYTASVGTQDWANTSLISGFNSSVFTVATSSNIRLGASGHETEIMFFPGSGTSVLNIGLNDSNSIISKVSISLKRHTTTETPLVSCGGFVEEIIDDSFTTHRYYPLKQSFQLEVTTARIYAASIVIEVIPLSDELIGWGNAFLELTKDECALGNGVSSDTWSNCETVFENITSTSQNSLKTLTANKTGNAAEEAVARYDIIVANYGLDNFITRSINSNRIIPLKISNNSASIYALVAISMVTMTVVGAYFFLRKKKEVK